MFTKSKENQYLAVNSEETRVIAMFFSPHDFAFKAVFRTSQLNTFDGPSSFIFKDKIIVIRLRVLMNFAAGVPIYLFMCKDRHFHTYPVTQDATLWEDKRVHY